MKNSPVTQIRLQNLRTIAELTLDLHGLQVLIGENGVGKSTVIEGIELLRRIAQPYFMEDLNGVHGGFFALLRQGQTSISLGLTVADQEGPLSYDLRLAKDGDRIIVDNESLTLTLHQPEKRTTSGKKTPLRIIERTRARARMFNQVEKKPIPIEVPAGAVLLSSFGLHPPQHAIGKMVAALQGIRVHVPFDVTPGWVARERRRPSPLRDAQVIEPADELSRYGVNLANAYSALRNDKGDAHWHETMEYVRLGLGTDIESVNVRPDPGGGAVGLRLKYKGVAEQIPAFALSDGTLAYLAFVALFRLHDGCSLLAFDEPETHLHPQLLMRVLGFFETLAERFPVVLATHSDRLLDGLEDPAQAARLLTLGAKRDLRVVHPEKAMLDKWLERYRGLGDVRAAGYEASVFPYPHGDDVAKPT